MCSVRITYWHITVKQPPLRSQAESQSLSPATRFEPSVDAELRDMKMQPALERALRHRGLLEA